MRFMNVQVNFLWTADQHKTHLEELGYSDVTIDSMSGVHVLDGWFPSIFLVHLDNAVITAKKPPPATIPYLPKVAVIGKCSKWPRSPIAARVRTPGRFDSTHLQLTS
jgi:hypothetical protein